MQKWHIAIDSGLEFIMEGGLLNQLFLYMIIFSIVDVVNLFGDSKSF